MQPSPTVLTTALFYFAVLLIWYMNLFSIVSNGFSSESIARPQLKVYEIGCTWNAGALLGMVCIRSLVFWRVVWKRLMITEWKVLLVYMVFFGLFRHVFMIYLGVAVAASVRIGINLGNGCARAAKFSYHVSLGPWLFLHWWDS